MIEPVNPADEDDDADDGGDNDMDHRALPDLDTTFATFRGPDYIDGEDENDPEHDNHNDDQSTGGLCVLVEKNAQLMSLLMQKQDKMMDELVVLRNAICKVRPHQFQIFNYSRRILQSKTILPLNCAVLVAFY